MALPTAVNNYYSGADTFKNIVVVDGGSISSDNGLFATDGAGNVLIKALAGGVSATAPATITGGTIATAGLRVSRSLPAGAITGAILTPGTIDGQEVTVLNEGLAASTITFAAVATSNVADGVSTVIAGLTGARFIWSANAAVPAWYHCK